LQCYFERPSGIAALSDASANGFTVSGCWRQQFDWAVIEWNRDNVFEHPFFRYLPDGDLSGLQLSYEETRENCIPLDSDLYATVDWPYLRLWADDQGQEKFYRVRLRDHATAVEGAYQPAWAEFELQGTPTGGDYAGISWPGEHHTYQLYGSDTLESAVQAVTDSVNAFSPRLKATRTGARIRLYYVGPNGTIEQSQTGHNGNRFAAYAYTSGTGSETWDSGWKQFSGGTSPSKWRIEVDFANLRDIAGQLVPTQAVRKMRWTYPADLQNGAFQRSEFQVRVTSWAVTGNNCGYQVAGPGTRRIEDDDARVQYSAGWTRATGNFSGGNIHSSNAAGSNFHCTYAATREHALYLGTRLAANGAQISVQIDNSTSKTIDLQRAGEDVLVRWPLGTLAPGPHTIAATHQGAAGTYFYFDFLECAVPAAELPAIPAGSVFALATDWDTDHSLVLAPERTAWIIWDLGFRGRVNHYAGALWFYELVRQNHNYASVVITFQGTPVPSELTEIVVGRSDRPPEEASTLAHLNHVGDTAETIAKVFEIEINGGYTGIRAEASGSQLTIFSRSMGTDGNNLTVSTSPTSGDFRLAPASAALSGGNDGQWRTDLAASPGLNRAARDWNRAFFSALAGYGLSAVTAFSMELQHGDPAPEAGIAQRYPNGNAVLLNTPALQTNFSPASLAFWREIYRSTAQLMDDAGLAPYLQFGEVQWWYFPWEGSGMPFCDDYTRQTFQARYGREMAVIPSNSADPSQYPDEVALLPQLIGSFTDSVIGHVRQWVPQCLFEVLYPTDVNDTALNRAINYPRDSWTASVLESLKTESFSYTFSRDLNKSKQSLSFGNDIGFRGSRKSHLVGIGDVATAWLREAALGKQAGMESVVLFALDQLCLIGYALPLRSRRGRSYFFR
jgi:hypothetical protein